MDTLKEPSFGPLQLGRGVIVAHWRSQRIELIEADPLLSLRYCRASDSDLSFSWSVIMCS